MTDEDRILKLINEQTELAKADKSGSARYRQVVSELIELLDEPLRAAFAAKRPGLEQAGHIGQEHRDVVGPTFIHSGSGIRADEQRPMTEVRGHVRSEMRSRSFDVQVDDTEGVPFLALFISDMVSSGLFSVIALLILLTVSPLILQGSGRPE